MRLAPLLVAMTLAAHTTAQAQTAAAPAGEQPTEIATLFDIGTSEWMATAGPAFGVVVFHSARDHKYLMSSLSWGRILTKPLGPGALRGRFQWAVEVVPLLQQYTPSTTFGVGVTPLTWRWNFDPRGKLAPFAELAGGLLWTRDPVPPETTSGNFTAHVAYGVRYFYAPRQALVASYTFHHISNGNRLEKNPGVNAHVAQVGFSFMRPR